MFGYALLGAGWLILKSTTRLRDWAYERAPFLAKGMTAILALAALVTLIRAQGIVARLAERPWAITFVFVCGLALWGVLRGIKTRRDGRPFAFTILFFLSAFGFLAAAFWPYMIPYSVTVANAAAPESSLSFLFWGAGLVALPVVLIYSVVVHSVFWGKLRITGH
jgi:cytochrome d ubiquinol oxidase subunit II